MSTNEIRRALELADEYARAQIAGRVERSGYAEARRFSAFCSANETRYAYLIGLLKVADVITAEDRARLIDDGGLSAFAAPVSALAPAAVAS